MRDPSGKMVNVHRVSYGFAYGPIPPGKQVLHRCDVRACVRPDHLFLGTQKDNMADMIDKGRQALGKDLNHPPQIGELNHNAKLTAELVLTIRGLYESKTLAEIQSITGVDRRNLWAVVHRKSWKHI
jgi:hypothetical protein